MDCARLGRAAARSKNGNENGRMGSRQHVAACVVLDEDERGAAGRRTRRKGLQMAQVTPGDDIYSYRSHMDDAFTIISYTAVHFCQMVEHRSSPGAMVRLVLYILEHSLQGVDVAGTEKVEAARPEAVQLHSRGRGRARGGGAVDRTGHVVEEL